MSFTLNPGHFLASQAPLAIKHAYPPLPAERLAKNPTNLIAQSLHKQSQTLRSLYFMFVTLAEACTAH
jgi:hypothetical protein